MPIYDMQCSSCYGYFNDIFCLIAELNTVTCPSCDAPMRICVRPIRTVGPMPSKPLRVSQIGRTFESNTELREYQRNNPGSEIMSASSDSWRAHKDLARDKAEAKARKMGFRDLDHRRETSRKVKEDKGLIPH